MKFKTLILIAMTFVIISLISSTTFAFTTDQINFGDVQLEQSNVVTITIDNTLGTSPINVTNITFTDLVNSGSTITSTNLSSNLSSSLIIPNGSSQDINVTLDLSSITNLDDLGTFTGNYTVETNSSNETKPTTVFVKTQDFDFSIDNISYNPSPVYENTTTTYYIQTSINGAAPNSVLDHCLNNVVSVNYADSSALEVDNFNGGTVDQYHLYNDANNYTINANLILPSYCTDTNSTNNELSLFLTVLPSPTYDLVMPNHFIFNMYRGTSNSLSKDETNNGNVDINVSNEINGLTNLNSSVSPSNIINFAPSTSKNVNISVTVPSTGVSPLTQITGTLNATFNTTSGLITKQSNITVNILNHQPTADLTNTVAIEENSFSSTITTSDEDSMDNTNCTITGGSAMSWLIASECSSLSGTAPSVSDPTDYTVIMNVTDGYETIQVTRTITVMPNEPKITTSDVTFSGDRGNTYTHQITIKNTGVQDLSNIDIDLQSISSSYNASLGNYVSSLATGDSMSVSLTLTIPDNQDSGLEDVGNIYVSADGTNGLTTSDNKDIFVDTDSMLTIENVDIRVDGENDQHDSNVNIGDEFEIYQGDDFTIKVNLENNYSSSQDVDINNVYYKLEADDNDFNIDFTSDEVNRIRAGDDEEIELPFEINTDNLNDGDTTNVTIKAYGKDDDNNFDHYDEFTFNLKYRKENNKITITNWNLNPSVVSCNESSFSLNVNLTNEGNNEEDGVFVNLQSSFNSFRLNTNSEKINNFDEDDEHTFSFTIPMNSRLTEGMHTIKVYAHYKYGSYDRVGDVKTIWINVQGPNCYVSTTSGNTGSNSESNTETNTETLTNTSSEAETNVLRPSTGGSLINIGPMIEGWITDTSNRFRLSDNVKIILWALLGLIVLAAIALGIVALVQRKRN